MLVVLSYIACARQGITFATAYDSLGEEGVRLHLSPKTTASQPLLTSSPSATPQLTHSVNEPEVYGMFTNANLMGTIAAVVPQTPSLKVLIYDGDSKDVKAGSIDTIKAANGGIQVYSFDEFVQLGKENPTEATPPQPEDTATIMYTRWATFDREGSRLRKGS